VSDGAGFGIHDVETLDSVIR